MLKDAVSPKKQQVETVLWTIIDEHNDVAHDREMVGQAGRGLPPTGERACRFLFAELKPWNHHECCFTEANPPQHRRVEQEQDVNAYDMDPGPFLESLSTTFGWALQDPTRSISQLIEQTAAEWEGVTLEGIDENGEFIPPWER